MDMRPLRAIVDVGGPFASAYFDCSHDTEDAARRIEVRWRKLREQLAVRGTGQSTLEAMDKAVGEAPPATGRAGHGLVAAAGRVLVDERLVQPPLSPIARASARPYLLPLAALVPRQLPHIVVVVDRTGADIRVGGQDEQTRTVQGREHPVHKIRGGGWAQHRIQNHVEHVVKQNLEHVAREVTRLVDETLARLLVVAGEVQARTELCREFPTRSREIAVETEAGRRAEGWDKEALDREVGRLVSDRADAEVAADIEAHRDRKLTIEGLESSTGALREANSDALLVSESMTGETVVWTGPEPFLVAARERDLRDLGMSGITAVRADEALPFAAISVGADVLVVGERLADGVGVLTRHR